MTIYSEFDKDKIFASHIRHSNFNITLSKYGLKCKICNVIIEGNI